FGDCAEESGRSAAGAGQGELINYVLALQRCPTNSSCFAGCIIQRRITDVFDSQPELARVARKVWKSESSVLETSLSIEIRSSNTTRCESASSTSGSF